MNHFQQPQSQPQQQQTQQTHVAQQSRREKLRIQGSLHPSSPQSGNQSDHSAGSASVLEAGRHGVPPDDSFNVASGRGFQAASDAVYNQNITSDPYSFHQTGSELLAYASATKQNGFLGSGVLSSQQQQQQQQHQHQQHQQHQHQHQQHQQHQQQHQQQGYSSQKNWSSGLSGGQQLGHFMGNPLSITGGNGIQGTSSASSAVATATLLNGGLQGSHHQLGRDTGPMTAYMSGQSAAQAEAMQLYLINSGYSGYTDASSPGNMVLISGGSAGGSTIQGGSQIPAPGQQHFIGIPLTPSTLSQDTSAGNGLASAAFPARDGGGGTSTATYSGSSNWRNPDELLFMPSSDATQQRKSLSGETGSLNHITDINDYALRQSSLSSMLGGGAQHSLLQATHRLELEASHPGGAVAAAGPSYQSLSLSLSNPNTQLHALESGMSSPGSQDGKKKLSSDLSHFRTSPRDSTLAAGSSYVGLSNNVSSTFSFVSGSRYLRAAQQLLDEVCSVGRGIKGSKGRGSQGTTGGQSPTAITSGGSVQKDAAAAENNSVKSEITMGSSMVPSPGAGPSAAAAVAAAAAGTNLAPSTTTGESRETSVAVLTQEEKQEHEGKKTKLLAMLQEVDRRYRQYYDQMQVVITSFDAVAGVGAATPYTALALQAMSRYFRCLRDAITGQIQVTCKALGEEDVTKSITSRPLTSRLRFIDQQIRQQRAYQQYGMLQQHAWRPQRGLPERSVSILRAWLFEHFLHPYPKDADKMMLARQTGLTRSQVSNWFINARVRLWKPMVEEMYQEETKEHELAMSGRAEGGSGEEKHHHDSDAGDKHPKHHQQQQHHDHHIQQQDMMQMEQQHQQPQGYTDYASMMSMRKPIESQMFSEQQQQLAKKTRLGIHDSSAIAVAAAVGLLDGSAGSGGMEVEVKPDNASEVGVHYQDHYGVSSHHHHHHQSGPLDSFESRNFAGRYSSAGFQQQQHQQQYPGSSSVSLTLGLRHCDSLQLGGSGGGPHPHQFVGGGGQQQQHGFMTTRHHISADSNDLCNIYGGATAASVVGGQAFGAGGGHHHLAGGDHDGIDQYQGGPARKQQHMEGHLLHDFVA